MIITLRRMNIQKLFLVLMLSGLLMACGGSEESTSPKPEAIATAAYSYPLTVGSTERHVVDQDAQPFLLVGDTAWSLLVAVSEADADMYLENRKQHGFTAVLANLIEYKYAANAPANFYGFTPFKGRPFTTPQEAYFTHVDNVLKLASEKGIAVFLFPLYLGRECDETSEGWCIEVQKATISDMRAWGEYVGNRYSNYDNIVWVIGGDGDPTPVKSKVQAMVDGIASKDTRHPFTVHNARGVMAVTPWSEAEWLNVNNIYTEGTDYQDAATAYNISPPKPFFLIEGQYENIRDPSVQMLRAQSYWTILHGGFGSFFGNCPVWGFGFTGNYCPSFTDWRTQLNSPGALSMKHFQALFKSRRWDTLVPDTSQTILIGGSGKFGSADYASSACAADGSSILIYLPSSRTITVSGECLSENTMIAWWYDPSNGVATQIGTFPTSTPQSFSPPNSGDWVLVLDSADAPFPAPGESMDSPREK
jgi:hypothetical protein